ncbi:helix-turn-helix transcriptional regulator [Actinomadura keratinilytica]|jgi:hypothetical protein|uniref:Helix-turn-helix transcriptional regulator n=1 Tax=Actinomadura keratinilytica TaxID=547461 RepID=A0ABP7XZQ8_9ACTN
MPTDYRAPNINARRLGLYLRRTRELLQLSYDEAAACAGCNSDWLVRVETGFCEPTPREVELLLERYGVRGAKVADLMIDLASRPRGPGWLAPHLDGMKAEERDALISESEASVIRTYGVQQIPELAQAEPYARFIASVSLREPDPDVHWEMLRNRQTYRPGGRRRFLDVIVDEMALTPRLADEVMVPQLRRLLELGDDPDASVRVVPSAAPFYEDRAHPFDVLEFPGVSDRISLCHTMLGIGFAYTDLTDVWTHIEQNSALCAEESREFIKMLLAARTVR